MNSTIRKHIRDISIIIVGAFIFSIGITYFALPNKLGEGGFTGIALLLYYTFHWSPSIVITILNIPLFVIGYKEFGRTSFVYTVIGLFAVTVFLEITEHWGHTMDDLLLVSLYTGVFVGVGLGMILRVGGTTGGVDIIARLISKYFGWSFGRTFFSIDFLVITFSIYIIGLNMAMYTLVAVFVGSRVLDFIIEGSTSKAVTIISEMPHKLAKMITLKMNYRVTVIEGKGGYSGDKREVLYAVVSPTEVNKLKHVVQQEDPESFIVVHDAREVLRKEFTSHP